MNNIDQIVIELYTKMMKEENFPHDNIGYYQKGFEDAINYLNNKNGY